MSWNHRYSIEEDMLDDTKLYTASIREVFYHENGETVIAYTDPIFTAVECDTKEQAVVELELELKQLLRAFEKEAFIPKED